MTPQLVTVGGRTIAHYEVLEKLGEGGMGVVYKARDTRLGRLVAIKFLAPRLAGSPPARERFLREARILSTLNHPHIAVIHDVDQWGGEMFLVFEHLPGGSLRTRPPRSLAQALEYALQLADAVGAAHQHGVVHRDVKPANVLFAADDTLKLADFGLARHASDVHLTGAGTAVGTPAYMAPELFQGREADARSDVYSLGVVVHELIAGKLPQAGHTLAVPLPLRPVLERALEEEPGRRHANAAEMAVDLRNAAAKLDTATRAETVVLHPAVPRHARWALAPILALAGLLVSEAPSGRRYSPGLPLTEQLVLLPLINAGGAADQALCDGLSDTLSAALTRLEAPSGAIRVVPASAARRESAVTLSDARRLLGAHFVVGGSVQPEAGGARLTLSVADARTARQLGGATATFAPQRLLLVEDWMVTRVARVLRIETPPNRGVGTRDPRAYELYLQAQGYLVHRDTAVELARAVAAFQEAARRDPGYVLARVGEAEALWLTWRNTQDPRWLEQAAASAQHARQCDEHVAAVHLILGRIETARGHHAEAVRALGRALELESRNTEAHTALAAARRAQGDLAQAEAEYRRVIELRPGDWPGYNDLAVLYIHQNRLAEAERLFQRMTAVAPESVMGYQNLGAVYVLMGRYAEACATLERALALKPTAAAYGNLGTAYYYEGRYAAAASVMEKAVEKSPADYVMWGNLGDAYWWAPGQQKRAPLAWNSAAELARGQLAIHPNDAQVRSSLAIYEARTGHYADALTEIAHARRLAGTDTRVLFKAARVYELCQRRQAALDALRAALEAGESVENVRREPEFVALRRGAGCAQILPQEICRQPGVPPRPPAGNAQPQRNAME